MLRTDKKAPMQKIASVPFLFIEPMLYRPMSSDGKRGTIFDHCAPHTGALICIWIFTHLHLILRLLKI